MSALASITSDLRRRMRSSSRLATRFVRSCTSHVGAPPPLRVLDGGLSTQLENHHGVDLTQHPKLWTAGLLANEAGRTKLRAAHDAFIEAGARIILSSSYQVNPTMDAQAATASVELALTARDECGHVLMRSLKLMTSGP